MDAHEPIPNPNETVEPADHDVPPEAPAGLSDESAARFAYYLTDEFTARLSEHLARARRKALADLDRPL